MAQDARSPRRATVFDVARVAGVSRGTVSRVLNGEKYVSEAARAAIERAIAEVGFVPNTAARNLVRRRTQAVAFIVHEPHSLFLEDPNIGAIMLGANATLSDADFQLVSLIVDSARDTARVARYLGGGFVDGAIMVSARTNDPITRAIETLRIPATFVGHPRGVNAAWVGIDNRSAAHAVTTELLRKGRSRVGMIAAALDRDSGHDRLEGYREALGERFDERLVAEVPLYSFHAGIEGMEALLAAEPQIDAVFAASDAVAAGAMRALSAAGKRTPDDVAVVGFDDSSWALRTDPPLTTVHQPAEGLGRAAATSVLDQIEGRATTTDGLLLDTPIVWRESA